MNLRKILENVCYSEILLSFLNDKERKKHWIKRKVPFFLKCYQQFARVGGNSIFSKSLCKRLQKKFLQQRCD